MRRSTQPDPDAQRRHELRRASLLREIRRFEGEAAAVADPLERARLQARAETYRCALHEDSA